jgi:hypothetical protein
MLVRRSAGAVALFFCYLSPQHASAEDHLEAKAPSAASAVEQGAFLPLSTAAQHAGRRASVKLLSGYDSASSSAQFRGEAEATLVGPLGLRVGASYDGIGQSSRPYIGGFLDVLDQQRYGINLALHGRFESASFNAVPGVVAGFALSRNFGGTLLAANAEYGSGLRGNERNAAAGLAALQQVAEHFRLGLDSRFQIDLERDLDEPKDEPDWRVVGGPLLLANMGGFAASLGGGYSALRYRLADTTHQGLIAYAGLGAAF